MEKLQEIEHRYVELERELAEPEVISDQDRYRKVAKAHSDLEEIVAGFRQLKKVMSEMASVEEMLEGKLEPELRELAEAELDELRRSREELETRLKIMLLPSDPLDEKNVIMEIRAGTGGEEVALFAGDLFRMPRCAAQPLGCGGHELQPHGAWRLQGDHRHDIWRQGTAA